MWQPFSSNPGLNHLSGSSFSPFDSAPDASILKVLRPVNSLLAGLFYWG
jgi:hypothetical protein